jgi:hypothetical protein
MWAILFKNFFYLPVFSEPTVRAPPYQPTAEAPPVAAPPAPTACCCCTAGHGRCCAADGGRRRDSSTPVLLLEHLMSEKLSRHEQEIIAKLGALGEVFVFCSIGDPNSK